METFKPNRFVQNMMKTGNQWWSRLLSINSFYENGELHEEKVEDEKYPTKYISYHKNGTIKSICVSNTQSQYEGHRFEFDENGK
jgi:hypothetical protein